MKVFLSWSGEKSKNVARGLSEWLPYINSEIEPWMSETDIGPGDRWSGEIARQLESTTFAIVCVTRDNQGTAWLNFEAGAIAKQVDEGRVVPLAIDLNPADVRQPLGAFNGVEMSKDGILRVLEQLNELCTHRVPDVAEACDRNWSALEPTLEAAAGATDNEPIRPDRELLEELLTMVRGLRTPQGPPTYDIEESEHLLSDLQDLVPPGIGMRLSVRPTRIPAYVVVTSDEPIPDDVRAVMEALVYRQGYGINFHDPRGERPPLPPRPPRLA